MQPAAAAGALLQPAFRVARGIKLRFGMRDAEPGQGGKKLSWPLAVRNRGGTGAEQLIVFCEVCHQQWPVFKTRAQNQADGWFGRCCYQAFERGGQGFGCDAGGHKFWQMLDGKGTRARIYIAIAIND